ncbi:MAG: branched-chain amino acid transporter permease [Rhodospirillales bacterium]|nr:branched-chain amino acid transporter permease [Rhodospirillales bacterium]
MAKLTRAKFTRERILILVGLALILAYPWGVAAVGQPFLIGLGARILVMGLAAASLDLIVGFGGMVSFGHAAFFGVGGYVVGILAFHAHDGTDLLGVIPGSNQALVAWPAAIVLGGLAALAIGALSLRTTGVHFIMITLAFAQMLFFLAVSLKTYGGDDGLSFRPRNLLPGLDTRNETSFYYVVAVLLVGFLILARRLLDARFGTALRGVRENERRLAALGIAPYGIKLAAFTLAGAVAGLAGALMANQARFVSPELLHWTKSGDLLIMVILGGLGTLYGSVLGAAVLIILETVLAAWTEHWMVVLGPVLVALILFARGGLWGVLAGTRRS